MFSTGPTAQEDRRRTTGMYGKGPTTIMELSPKKPSPVWFWGPNYHNSSVYGPSGGKGFIGIDEFRVEGGRL